MVLWKECVQMSNDKVYLPTDYINAGDLNSLVDDCATLCGIYVEIFGDMGWVSRMYHFTVNMFPLAEWIAAIEYNIEYIANNFYKPVGYIENRNWHSIPYNSYQNFSYEDMNRMITDMKLLYDARNDEVTIWNGQSFVDWEIESDLEWEEY